MGRIIKPEKIKEQVSSMKKALQKDNQDLLCVLSNIGVLNSSEELQGIAWSSVKEHMSNHKSVIQGIICANEEMIADGEALERAAGDEDLVEDDIYEMIRHQKGIRDTCDQRIDDCQDLIRRCSSTVPIGGAGLLHISFAKEQISHQEALAASADAIIWEQELKIDKIDEIERNTDRLYQGASVLYANANAGLLTLEDSWSGSGFAADSLDWKTALDSRWGQREEINNKTAKVFLLDQGVTKKQIQNMMDLGFTLTQIKAGWDLMETKDDRKFFKYLMDGTPRSYVKAFEIDPDGLSDNMTVVMAGYACHLVQLDYEGEATKESIQQLTDFNNALLSSITIYGQDAASTGPSPHLVYRDIYLERLYCGSELLNRGEAVTLAAMDPTAKGYQQKVWELKKNIGMANLWALQTLTLKKLGEPKIYEYTRISISNLSYRGKGNMGFDLNHFSTDRGEMVTERVQTDMLWNTNTLANEWGRQDLQEQRKEREHLFRKYLGKTVEGSGFLLLGAYAPQLVLLASIGSMAISGTASIRGLDSYIDSKGGKLAANSGSLAVQNMVNYWIAISDMEKSLTNANFKNKMEWFGMGAGYEIDGGVLEDEDESVRGVSISGMYDPDVIRMVEVWERKGIAGWIGWTKDEVDKVEEQIDNSTLSQSKKDDCMKLLNGNYKIVKEEDMVYFIDRIRDIERAYDGLDKKKKEISIQSKWRNLLVNEKEKL